MGLYLKRPLIVRALRFLETNLLEIIAFVGSEESIKNVDGRYLIETLEGPMVLNHGDYVVKGIIGESYPVPQHIFHMLYDPVGSDQYRKKPIPVQAVLYNGKNLAEIIKFSKGRVYIKDGELYLQYPKGDMKVPNECYIVLGPDHETFYVCQKEVFEEIHNILIA